MFAEYDRKRAAALADYYHFARGNDLYLTYVIINPQADRSKAAHEQGGEHLTAAVVDEDAGGLTVHGAKMLATGGIMANEILVASIQPLQPGDENYAISFALPLATPGLKVLSRKSYEQSAGSVFDNPFAARFDENDAVIHFDQVKVPWERVFVDRDIEMCRRQFHATPAHIYQNYQAQIRLRVKLRFLVGWRAASPRSTAPWGSRRCVRHSARWPPRWAWWRRWRCVATWRASTTCRTGTPCTPLR